MRDNRVANASLPQAERYDALVIPLLNAFPLGFLAHSRNQVVKGAEPLFTSALSVLTGSQMPWPVYLTLLPIIGGVGMASAGELSFSAVAFAAAMTSNACAASRSVLGKMFMAREEEVRRRVPVRS